MCKPRPTLHPLSQLLVLVPAVTLTACLRPLPAPPVATSTTVDAPIDVVARAAREELLHRRIAFDLADTSSVSITSEPMPLEYGRSTSAVSCRPGTGPGHAVYHVSLTREGTRTIVTPHLAYNKQSLGGPQGHVTPEGSVLGRCPSTRVWEAEYAFAVKERAEGRPLSFATYMDTTAKPFLAANDGRFYANIASCREIAKLPAEERRYIATETEALAAGLRRSSVRGC